MPITEITWTLDQDGMFQRPNGIGGSQPLLAESAAAGAGVLLCEPNTVSEIISLTTGIFPSPPDPPLNWGFIIGIMGAVMPGTLNGVDIFAIVSEPDGSGPGIGQFNVILNGILPVGFFTSVTINGFTFLTAAVDFYDGMVWRWSPANPGLIDTVVYPVEFVLP